MRSLPARPPAGEWPAEMRADLAANFFDFDTTGQFTAAISRGEAPPPTSTRTYNAKKVPVWARAACEEFILRRHDLSDDGAPSTRLQEVEFA
jgi:hypothetical protein